MKENRIIVPKTLRNEMKNLLHTGHLGRVKTIGRARETMFWPGINADIDELTNLS